MALGRRDREGSRRRTPLADAQPCSAAPGPPCSRFQRCFSRGAIWRKLRVAAGGGDHAHSRGARRIRPQRRAACRAHMPRGPISAPPRADCACGLWPVCRAQWKRRTPLLGACIPKCQQACTQDCWQRAARTLCGADETGGRESAVCCWCAERRGDTSAVHGCRAARRVAALHLLLESRRACRARRRRVRGSAVATERRRRRRRGRRRQRKR
mmetsp:Transcript_39485/g.82849  ORF Transcript_39485/g.82849 Transcript_39485/m.82849 type:complete len:212 (-) Transcript_39485:963-1598(-)